MGKASAGVLDRMIDLICCTSTFVSTHTHTGGDPSIRHPALRRPPRFQPRTPTPTTTTAANDDESQGQQEGDNDDGDGGDRGGMIVMEVKDPALAGEAALSVLAPLAEIVLEQRVALMADRIGQGRRRPPQGGEG